MKALWPPQWEAGRTSPPGRFDRLGPGLRGTWKYFRLFRSSPLLPVSCGKSHLLKYVLYNILNSMRLLSRVSRNWQRKKKLLLCSAQTLVFKSKSQGGRTKLSRCFGKLDLQTAEGDNLLKPNITNSILSNQSMKFFYWILWIEKENKQLKINQMKEIKCYFRNTQLLLYYYIHKCIKS